MTKFGDKYINLAHVEYIQHGKEKNGRWHILIHTTGGNILYETYEKKSNMKATLKTLFEKWGEEDA